MDAMMTVQTSALSNLDKYVVDLPIHDEQPWNRAGLANPAEALVIIYLTVY